MKINDLLNDQQGIAICYVSRFLHWGHLELKLECQQLTPEVFRNVRQPFELELSIIFPSILKKDFKTPSKSRITRLFSSIQKLRVRVARGGWRVVLTTLNATS